jgi:hypothetical protein
MDSINYVFFNSGFKGSSCLTYVRFPIGVRNSVNSWAKHQVEFIFGGSKKLFASFVGFKYGFDILLGQEFHDVINGALDIRKR